MQRGTCCVARKVALCCDEAPCPLHPARLAFSVGAIVTCVVFHFGQNLTISFLQGKRSLSRGLTMAALVTAARRICRSTSVLRGTRSISIVQATVTDDQSFVEVCFDDGHVGRFNNMWLR